MDDFRVEVWGLFDLSKKQILIFQMISLLFFIILTAFLFSYDFHTHLNNVVFNFHAVYAKYFSLASTISIVIETQFMWSKFTKAQLNLIQEQKAEIEQQKEEIMSQNDMLLDQKDKILEHQNKIETQNKDIKGSIRYASKIQSALLPSHTKMARLLRDYFLTYKPRDIISGDFYWIDEYKGKTIIAASDCTGHGVPGAFVSALGISILNEILQHAVLNKEQLNPGRMLNRLNDRMLETAAGTENKEDTYDGMDISVCMIDREQNILEYAGALAPVYIIRKQQGKPDEYELSQLKPDVHSISMTEFKEHTYQNTIINFNKDDLLYMFSDGFIDQFGGPNMKKFLTSNFKSLLLKIANEDMYRQQKLLEKKFLEWKGNYEQVDDIMIIGIKL